MLRQRQRRVRVWKFLPRGTWRFCLFIYHSKINILEPHYLLWLLAFCGYFFVASSHKICGEEGSPFLWLLVVPTYDAHLQGPKLGPVRMFQDAQHHFNNKEYDA
jgi:hypothetical protein